MSTLLAPILQYFFTEHLTSHKQVSPRTIVAYRDSFRLLLQFLKKKTGKQPSTLFVDDLDASAILDFLEHLEEQRDNQICSLECPAYRDSILFPCCGSARSGQRRCCQSRPCHSEETNR